MKLIRPSLFVLVFSLSCIFAACRKTGDAPTPEPIGKDSVLAILHKNYWRVEKIFRLEAGNKIPVDTVAFLEPWVYPTKRIFLRFPAAGEPKAMSSPGDPQTQSFNFKKPANVYFVALKLQSVMNVTYQWDELLATIVLKSHDDENTLRSIQPGVTAVLDKKSIVSYSTRDQEETASTPSNLTFNVEYKGKNYELHLKAGWVFPYQPLYISDAVVFF